MICDTQSYFFSSNITKKPTKQERKDINFWNILFVMVVCFLPFEIYIMCSTIPERNQVRILHTHTAFLRECLSKVFDCFSIFLSHFVSRQTHRPNFLLVSFPPPGSQTTASVVD